ncbi:MAG TPA: FGGY family carbohydrate kinase [Acidisoma sp.]|uniref:xylulokinase n=1 Tax=Acidisoma sp. TaxID=1872115 RepID=UPI002CCD4C2C|nr:FGGY family carbohydrate kinase [Acidisoma sp.]HTI02978.1 FGGY family carbohydrate kinase [Acidisoma sp.]
MTTDLILAIDVGTGSARAALIDGTGRIRRVAAQEHEQIVPQFGWAEQKPEQWWEGTVAAIRALLAAEPDAAGRIEAIAACGQMHGTVLIDADGRLARETAPLWNDKRTAEIVAAYEKAHAPSDYLGRTGNPPTPAWPGFKLAWLKAQDPEAYRRTAHVLMPKDFINYRLTGEVAMDAGDASCSFLMDCQTATWSIGMIESLGLDTAKLPPIRGCLDILGHVTDRAAGETGLRAGTPVLVGGADYPVALLGSGVCRPGLASDVTGTSCIITVIAEKPILDAEICNVATVEGNWGAFVLLETGGDAVRWARRALHEKRLDYAGIMDRAAEAPAGSGGLFFLPYLTGERLGAHRNARAQYFGLAAGHELAHLDRALLEGVAFAGNRSLRIMAERAGQRVERVVATSGGAKSPLWLKIKASAYNIPIVVPEEAESGLVGCAAMAAAATGRFSSLQGAVDAFVRYQPEVLPDPAWVERYARMQPIFDTLYRQSQSLYDALDALA